MNEDRLEFHPMFGEMVKYAAKLEEQRTRLLTVAGTEIFERVQKIVEVQAWEKRAIYYGMAFEAVCDWEDFSGAKSIEDILGAYAQTVVRRAFQN